MPRAAVCPPRRGRRFRTSEQGEDKGRDHPGGQRVAEPAAHDATHGRVLAARRGDRGVGHRRDVVAEGRPGQDGSDEGDRPGLEDARRGIEERSADQDRAQARPRRRGEQDCDQERQEDEASPPHAEFAPGPHQGMHEPGLAEHHREDACQQPCGDHEHHDRPRHPPERGRAVVGGAPGKQQSHPQRPQEDGPEAALVGGAREAQPGRAGGENQDGSRGAREAQVEPKGCRRPGGRARGWRRIGCAVHVGRRVSWVKGLAVSSRIGPGRSSFRCPSPSERRVRA